MRVPKLLSVFLLFAMNCCGQKSAKHKVDPSVTNLCNKIVPLVSHLTNLDSCKQALLYLDSATKIDNNCFLCYYNKLMFLNSLKQYNRAVETMNECIRLKPSAYDLYLTGGILYEKVGDTVSSKRYFQKSLTILNPVLDTISFTNRDYEMLLGNKAINLVMLGNQEEANVILKKLYDRQTDEELKKMTLSMMNKNKTQLLKLLKSE